MKKPKPLPKGKWTGDIKITKTRKGSINVVVHNLRRIKKPRK